MAYALTPSYVIAELLEHVLRRARQRADAADRVAAGRRRPLATVAPGNRGTGPVGAKARRSGLPASGRRHRLVG